MSDFEAKANCSYGPNCQICAQACLKRDCLGSAVGESEDFDSFAVNSNSPETEAAAHERVKMLHGMKVVFHQQRKLPTIASLPKGKGKAGNRACANNRGSGGSDRKQEVAAVTETLVEGIGLNSETCWQADLYGRANHIALRFISRHGGIECRNSALHS